MQPHKPDLKWDTSKNIRKPMRLGPGVLGADAGCIFVLFLFLCKKQKLGNLYRMMVGMA